MNEIILKQLKEKEYNQRMLYSLYNMLEDGSYLVRLNSHKNELFSVNDFEWIRLEFNKEEQNINMLYNDIKKYLKTAIDGDKNGIFVIKMEEQLYIVKLKSFDVKNI